MNLRRSRQQGFTLLEILVAAALTAVAVGMSISIINSTETLWADQQARSTAARDGWRFVDKLCRELRETVPPAQLGNGAQWHGASARQPLVEAVSTAGWPDSGIDEMNRAGRPENREISADSIQFPALRVPIQGLRAEPGLLEYSLKRDLKNHVVGISRRVTPLGGSPAAAEESEMSHAVVSLEFQYLGADGRWQASWNDASAVPRAVRITVGTLVRPSRMSQVPFVTRFTTVVYLPADSRIPL